MVGRIWTAAYPPLTFYLIGQAVAQPNSDSHRPLQHP